jgi:hypothetical protein
MFIPKDADLKTRKISSANAWPISATPVKSNMTSEKSVTRAKFALPENVILIVLPGICQEKWGHEFCENRYALMTLPLSLRLCRSE